jgi:hypothetical protein
MTNGGANLETLYSALAASAAKDLEDTAAARDALVLVDERWHDDRDAWLLISKLVPYARERKRAAQSTPHNAKSDARTLSVLAYYTALQLQDDIRRKRLHTLES